MNNIDAQSGREFNRASGASMSDEEISNKLQGYFLVRGYHKDASPYAIVTDLSMEEAVALCEAVEPERGMDELSEEGVRDQDGYMQRRIQTENWLRDAARASGVDMAKDNPVYFAFTREPERFTDTMNARRPDTKIVIFPAHELDLSTWSFTMDDHFFAALDSDAAQEGVLDGYESHPLHRKVLSASELVAAIDEYGYPEDEFKHNFEAQMWADEPGFKQNSLTQDQSAPEIKPASQEQTEDRYVGQSGVVQKSAPGNNSV